MSKLPTRPPENCNTKQHIRAEIDRIDQLLLSLFAERQGYVRRMAEIKQNPEEAFDAERIETMVADIKTRAAALDLEPEQVEEVWRCLIDWNVAYEKRTILRRLNSSKK
ncbi:isochorismate pyruvate lyase [Roseibium hamelinense]|uniref:chorismate mutase n=1 Tax=Roseibium hamelinense TaxID=150831 RepID=A0A562T3P4_9HYPH|nr:chorismate mutase [Roseibium hamelinense]MTI42205.1 chorismate mutase [Roseibium hamelinense]TWI87666.1 isochorismate pyruvate lyase [Roseibium hamelinense]